MRESVSSFLSSQVSPNSHIGSHPTYSASLASIPMRRKLSRQRCFGPEGNFDRMVDRDRCADSWRLASLRSRKWRESSTPRQMVVIPMAIRRNDKTLCSV